MCVLDLREAGRRGARLPRPGQAGPRLLAEGSVSPGVATPAVTGQVSQNSQHWAPCAPPLLPAKVSSSSYRHSLRASTEHGTADNPQGQDSQLWHCRRGPRSTPWHQEHVAAGSGGPGAPRPLARLRGETRLKGLPANPKAEVDTQEPPNTNSLPGQPQAGTHKSVKSSSVSSGVNTSSSPITWGGGQAPGGRGLGHPLFSAGEPPATAHGPSSAHWQLYLALAHVPTDKGYFWMETAGILWGRGSLKSGAAPSHPRSSALGPTSPHFLSLLKTQDQGGGSQPLGGTTPLPKRSRQMD